MMDQWQTQMTGRGKKVNWRTVDWLKAREMDSDPIDGRRANVDINDSPGEDGQTDEPMAVMKQTKTIEPNIEGQTSEPVMTIDGRNWLMDGNDMKDPVTDEDRTQKTDRQSWQWQKERRSQKPNYWRNWRKATDNPAKRTDNGQWLNSRREWQKKAKTWINETRPKLDEWHYWPMKPRRTMTNWTSNDRWPVIIDPIEESPVTMTSRTMMTIIEWPSQDNDQTQLLKADGRWTDEDPIDGRTIMIETQPARQTRRTNPDELSQWTDGVNGQTKKTDPANGRTVDVRRKTQLTQTSDPTQTDEGNDGQWRTDWPNWPRPNDGQWIELKASNYWMTECGY